MENNRQDEFDALPFEMQMRINAMRREHEQMMENIDSVASQIVRQVSILQRLGDISDPSEMNAVLFCAAEWAEKLKSCPGGEELAREWAREFDWMRHVLRDRGIDKAHTAVEAVRDATTGNITDARIFARGIDYDNSEFDAITDYWQQHGFK